MPETNSQNNHIPIVPDRTKFELRFIQAVSLALFLLCGFWMKDQGEPGRPIEIRLLQGAVSGFLLCFGLIVIQFSLGRKLRFLSTLILLPCGLASAFVMTAYGWPGLVLTIVFYGYVVHAIFSKRWLS